MLDFISSLSITTIFVIIAFYGVLGVWCLVDCAITDSFSKNKKAFWIILLAFSCLLSDFFYALFISKSKTLKGFTIISIVALIFCCIFLYFNRNGLHNISDKHGVKRINKPIQTHPAEEQLHIKADE